MIYSLYSICVNEIARLLMENYWKDDAFNNPFLAFHPNVIHDLISCICMRTTEHLKSSHLLLLLTSGRVTNFKLDDVRIKLDDAEDIFQALLPWSERLKSIKINKDVHCVDTPWISSDLGILLRSSKALVSLETCIPFKLAELFNCVNLQKLILNFVISESLSSFLYVDGDIHFNHSLKVLKIFKFQTNPKLYLDIAEILEYCVELVEIDYDVTRSLVHLHEKIKDTKFKLRKASLGSNYGPLAFRATNEAISITSTTCPDLREVNVSPADCSAIYALGNFHHITVLVLNEPKGLCNDYHSGVQPLLEIPHFGHNLVSLTLKYFSAVDFASVGTCCPNVEELRVEYFSEDNRSEFTQNSFRKLISLYVENINDDPCEAALLIGILSNAVALEFLTIRNASKLTDSVLDNILRNDAVFSKLETINIEDCGLSINGLRMLAMYLTSVKCVLFSSHTVSEEEATNAFRELGITLFSWP